MSRLIAVLDGRMSSSRMLIVSGACLIVILFLSICSSDLLVVMENNNTIMISSRSNAPTRTLSVTSHTDPSLYLQDKTMQISRKHKVVFIHVPKAGGTVIEESPLFADAWEHHVVGGHMNIANYYRNGAERQVDDFESFSVVRHPCERFISAFNYLTSDKPNKGDKEWVGEHIGDRTLDEWAQVVTQDVNNTHQYAHFNPMHSWLFAQTKKDEEVLSPDRLFCQEHFGDAVDWINEKYEDEIIPSNSKHALQLSHQSCSALPAETRAFIEEKYSLDYCVFGYAKGLGGYREARQHQCEVRNLDKEAIKERYLACKEKLDM